MKSIRSVTFFALLFTSLIPLLLAFGIAGSLIVRTQSAMLSSGRAKLVEILTGEIESILENASKDLQILGQIPKLLTPEEITAEGGPWRQFLSGDFISLSAFDSDGYVIETTVPVRFTRETSLWFREALRSNGPLITPPFPNPQKRGSSLISFYLPVPQSQVATSGISVIRADMDFERIADRLDNVDIAGSEQLILMDASRNVLYSRNRSSADGKWKGALKRSREGPYDVTSESGEGFICLSSTVQIERSLFPERPWHLLWLERSSSYHKPLFEGVQIVIFSAVLACLLSVVFSCVFTKRLCSPIRETSDAARFVAEGDLDVHLPESGVREIAVLHKTFNSMVGHIRSHRASLEERVAERTRELEEVNTELEGTIDQLRQAQKMEAVGVMAGGIAHDFNNLLTAINGNLMLARDTVPAGPVQKSISGYLDNALEAGERSARIVRQLLGFSRQTGLQLGATDLSEIVGETCDIIRITLGSRLDLELELADSCPVWADENQIQQVITNLCLNARDAMDETGHLRVRTRIVTDQSPPASVLEAAPGDYCLVEVEDDGIGMSPEVTARIFEPFFTTKNATGGSGLGLAMCYGIVHQHGGWITCESVPDEGTTFRVFLPCLRETEVPPRRERRKSPTALSEKDAPVEPADWRDTDERRYSVLLADDEDPVRLVAQRVLERAGYRVIPVANGQEALDALQSELPDLVILDGNMPVLSGQEAFRAIYRAHPGLPVVICTGNVDVKEGFLTAEGGRPFAFVGKPYTFEQLTSICREAILGCVIDDTILVS